MINISGIPSHPAREFLEMSSCAPGPALLEPALQGVRSLSGISDLLAGMDLAIAVYGKVLDSEIYAKNINRVIRRLFRNLHNNSKVEDVLNQQEVGLASNSIHSSLLIFSDSDRDKLPAFESNQRYVLKALPGENALIIDNGTIWSKFRSDGFISLVGFNYLGDCSDSELRRKTVPLTNRVIDCLVDLNLVGLVHKESCSSDVIAGFIEAMHRVKEQLMLYWARIESDHQGLKHYIEENVQ